MYFKLHIKKEIDRTNIENPVVLIGWPGIALVAKLAISSIIDSINAEEFLNIECYDFPAKSNVEKGALEIPNAKVYYKAREGNTKNDFFILTANYQPQTAEGIFYFSEKFCQEMDKITNGKIEMYVSTGAMVSDDVHDPPFVHVCGTHQEINNKFLNFKDTILMDNGVIAGANGILPAYAGYHDYAPGVCLLAETLPLPMMTLDPRSSKALVAILKEFFKINMDFTELDKKIAEMESVIESYKKQANHYMKGIQEDRGPDSYFR